MHTEQITEAQDFNSTLKRLFAREDFIIRASVTRFHMEMFNLKKLNDAEGKEQYRVEISNEFASLENLDAEANVNRAWETITENIKI
jgi:hypothetical protein